MIDEEGGYIIYLRGHEGRGIGLSNKIQAYHLQDQGLDTVEANEALNLPIDDRDYTAACQILQSLNINPIRLITNNPDKIHQTQQCGIQVTERIPLVIKKTNNNEHYLETKEKKLGHHLKDTDPC